MHSPKVLYEDNHLIVVDKPANMPCVPDETRDLSTYDWVRQYIKKKKNKPGNVFLGIFQRLDRPVSGVLAFAKTSKAARRLNEAIKGSGLRKYYLAITVGLPPKAQGREYLWLKKDRRKNVVAISHYGVGQRAVTKWRLMRKIGANRGLVLLEPETGRPHQLRITLANMGCPIEGDVKYGAPTPLKDRSIALHSTILQLFHPVKKVELYILSAPKRPPFPKIPDSEVLSLWKNSPSQGE